MKRKKERYLRMFSEILKNVKVVDYFFQYKDFTINLWWLNGKIPNVDIMTKILHKRYTIFFEIPLPILKTLVEELSNKKYEKVEE